MKISKLVGLAAVFWTVSMAQAAPQTPKNAPKEITMETKAAPAWLVAKGVRVVASSVAPVGPNYAPCYVLFITRGQSKENANPVKMQIWLPKGPNSKTWKRLRNEPLGWLEDYQCRGAYFRWLNWRTKKGFVLQISKSDETRLLAFPEEWKTKKRVEQAFSGGSTSQYSGSYDFSDIDKRGFMMVGFNMSEPGRDEEGNTITISSSEGYYWNGKGWGN